MPTRAERRHATRALTAAGFALALPALLGAAPPPGSTSPVLVSYSFEDDVPTGPDTFAIYAHARGSVRLSDAFRVSGFRSVEIRDVAGDGDFPELQGYLPVRRSGALFAHFALLVATPLEEWNVALAGPAGFVLGKDGIAVWLRGLDGWLVHVSDSVPRRLARIEPFVWYAIDLAYHVDRGRYDLRVRREGEEQPLASLLDQPGAAAQPGSAVDKFSFVGDPGTDRSAVTYYVDDVLLTADAPVQQPGFVAPGRRRLFVEWFSELQRATHGVRCLPAFDLGDVLGARARTDLESADLTAAARELLDPSVASQAGPSDPRLAPLVEWREGCSALAHGDAAAAVSRLTALAGRETGSLVPMSLAVASAADHRPTDADGWLAEAYARTPNDPRYAVAAALVGLARGDLDQAESWLRDPADRALRDTPTWLPARPADLDALKRQAGAEWRERLEAALAADQYFFVRLWHGELSAARDYALAMAERLGRSPGAAAVWRLRAGDAAFGLRDLAEARALYEGALGQPTLRGPAALRLSDVAFLSGDADAERRHRESLYGTLSASGE